jgi:cyclic beta-1,2-glucan synthetase
VLVWAEATGAAIGSHRRDVDTLMPWLAIPDELLAELARDFPDETRAIRGLTPLPGLPGLARSCMAALAQLEAVRAQVEPTNSSLGNEIDRLIDRLRAASAHARALAERLSNLARLSRELFDAMHFDFLTDRTRQIFSIGYRVATGTLDPAGYDLLASEARLASFVAIAKGDITGTHWFRLSRPMTPVGFGAALVSWSGSMFEYLMPALVMDSPRESLLDQTARLVVRRQMTYAADRGVPWGVSESAYNVRDPDFIYQYSNFGVPGLGLDRNLGESLVIAPYATALAAMVDPGAAALNFAALARAGGRGPLGFYDALDYTGTRLTEGQTVAVVRAYMAHHQAMTLLALANVIDGGAMRARFHREPIVQATELLLQERPPESAVVTRLRPDDVATPARVRAAPPPVVHQFASAHSVTPEIDLLGSGRDSRPARSLQPSESAYQVRPPRRTLGGSA